MFSIFSAFELAAFGDRVYFGCSADTHGPSRRLCSAPWGGREDRRYALSGADIVDLAVDQDYVYTLSQGIHDRERIIGDVDTFER